MCRDEESSTFDTFFRGCQFQHLLTAQYWLELTFPPKQNIHFDKFSMKTEQGLDKHFY